MSKNIEKLILEDIKKSNNVSYSALDKAMARMDEKIAEQQANKKFNLRFLYILSPIVAACILIAILIPILINNNVHRGYNDLVDGTFSYSELTKEEIVSIEEYNKEYNTDYLYFDEYEIIESNKLVRKENILMIEECYLFNEFLFKLFIVSNKSIIIDFDKYDFNKILLINDKEYRYYVREQDVIIQRKSKTNLYYISINTIDLDIVKEILSNL